MISGAFALSGARVVLKTLKSWIIIEADVMSKKLLPPIPPGEILLEEFMKPNDISQNRLARDIDINPARVNDIVHGRSAITAPVALRLAKYFNTTPELWMNLQAGYELRKARADEWPKIEPRVRILAAG